MAILNDMIPTTKRASKYDASNPNPNAIALPMHGPRAATITKFSGKFFELNVGTEDKPQYQECTATTPGAIPRIRVYLSFAKVKNLVGEPLVLSTKMRLSLAPRATLAILVGGILGIAPEEAQNARVDMDSLIGSPVIVQTFEGRNGNVMVKNVSAAPRDEDEFVPAPSPARAAAPAVGGDYEDPNDFFA